MNLSSFLLTLLISLPMIIGVWIFQIKREQRAVTREIEFADGKVLNIGIQFGFSENIFVIRYEDSQNFERVGTCTVRRWRVNWISGAPY